MRLRRLISIPRLARNVLVSLLDRRAALGPGSPIPVRMAGAEIGQVGAVIWRRRQVEVRGRIDGAAAGLGFDERPPVAVGSRFEIRLDRPAKSAALTLSVETDAGRHVLRLAAPGRLREALARAAALPGALAEVLAERPAVLAFLRTGDQAVAAGLRRRFGLMPEDDATFPVPPDLFAEGGAPPCPAAPVTIVVPVFNAAPDLRRLLGCLSRDPVDWHRIVLVDDGSDDPAIAPIIADFCARHRETATAIAFPGNRGFVAAANAGIAAAGESGHIVLLNTDTLPPPGWLARLVAPLDADPAIASVTPMSTSAEILSIPAAGIATGLDAALIGRLDAAARRIAPAHRVVEIPTGIGFCMALGRGFLDRIGAFDTAFGQGYGEEVDWCQRARAAGGRNVAATNLVVGHRGGASFGALRPARIRAASRVVAERWPDYDGDVQRWIRAAPAGPQRLSVSLAWLAATSPGRVPILLGHSLGGGAEVGLEGELRALREAGAPGAVVLRTGGHRAWRVELHGPGFVQAGEVAEGDLVHELLAPVAARHVIYSCGVGARDPASVPEMLLALAAPGARLDLRLHDFFPVSPSWNLLDGSGAFRGVPDRDTRDPAHSVPRAPGRAGLPHRAWRALWERVIARAGEITVYAPSGAELLVEAYPLAAGRTVLRPHALTGLPARIAPGGTAVGVLGGISRAKGAEVLCRLARLLKHRRIVVIGEMDGQFRLPAPHLIHGRYDRSRIGDLARSYGVGLWLIPSVCPETFSFAMHEALATGLPVLTFDRGAQGDAARAAPNGHLLADPADTAALADRIETLLSR